MTFTSLHRLAKLKLVSSAESGAQFCSIGREYDSN